MSNPLLYALSFCCVTALVTGCATSPGTLNKRKGDEIVVAGQFFHTGTRVVTWMDPGGYDAYRVEKRFGPMEKADWKSSSEDKERGVRSPNRYSLRRGDLTEEELERVRGGGWDLPTVQRVVDQFVIHFDVAGTSKSCFKVLHDIRTLSVHFLLDLDGTIYQTLDVKETAWHATTSNGRSVGIEIANMGAYSASQKEQMEKWYRRESDGRTSVVIPAWVGTNSQRTPNFVGYPARREPVTGRIQAGELSQYDFTPQQYEALVKLTATLCKVLPKLKCDYPRDATGKLITHKLPDDQLKNYQGVLGHYHVQSNKVDPGPAFQWDYVIENARRLIKQDAEKGAEAISAMPVKMLRDN